MKKSSIFFFVDHEKGTYLPLHLYKEALSDILINHMALNVIVLDEYTEIEVYKHLYDRPDVNVFVFYFNPYISKTGNPAAFQYCINRKFRMILINCDPVDELYDTVTDYLSKPGSNKDDIIVLEYIYDTMVKQRAAGINVHFLPPMYHPVYENYYNTHINRKLSWKEKDIDILIFGLVTDRRQEIINRLGSNRCNVVCIRNEPHEQAFNMIERSKIILNIESGYHGGKLMHNFDYFRLAILYSNNAFVITETPNVNPAEKNLDYWEGIIVSADYDKIESCAYYFLNEGEHLFNDITSNIKKWFSGYPMQNYIIPIFQEIVELPIIQRGEVVTSMADIDLLKNEIRELKTTITELNNLIKSIFRLD